MSLSDSLPVIQIIAGAINVTRSTSHTHELDSIRTAHCRAKSRCPHLADLAEGKKANELLVEREARELRERLDALAYLRTVARERPRKNIEHI